MSQDIANQLYLVYLGRPADVSWRKSTADLLNGSAPSVALQNAFFSAAVLEGTYSLNDSPSALVNKIFQNIFGFAANGYEQQQWGDLITKGVITAQTAAWTIFNSYLGATNLGALADTYQVPARSKLIAINDYTNELQNNGAANVAVSQIGGAAAAAARAVISGINSAAGAAALKTNITATVNNTSTAATGTTYTLTTSSDNIPGTSGNDVINGGVNYNAGTAAGTASTFTASDVVRGGAGTDSLNLTLENAGGGITLPGADVSGVEVFNLRNISGQTLTVDAAAISGVNEYYADRSTAAITINNLASGAVAGAKGNGLAAVPTLTYNYTAAATAAVLTLSDGLISTGAGAVTLTGAGLTTVTVNSTGATNNLASLALPNGVKAITINATGGVNTGNITGVASGTAITVTGNGAANIGAIAANVTSVTATDNAGGVTLTMNNVATTKYVGGSGGDIITTGGIALTTGSVDAGAGTTDRLVVANTTDLNSAALGAKYSNFESLQVNNGVDTDLSFLSATNTISAIRINDGAGNTSVSNLSAAQAGAVTVVATNASGASGIAIGVSSATNPGQIDTVKLALLTTTTAGAAQNINLTGVTLTGVEKLELTGTGAVAATTGNVTFTTANATSLDSIKFTAVGGGNVLTVDAGHTATNLSIDASASSGGTTINASAYNVATGASLTGGSGADNLLGTAKADIINGGAGNDFIAAGALTAKVQTINYGAANTNAASTATVTVDGVSVTTTSLASGTTPGALATAVQTALAADTTLAGRGYTFTVSSAIVTVTAPATVGDLAAPTNTFSASNGVTPSFGVTTPYGIAGGAADILTGGAGNDTFNIGATGGSIANTVTITDLNLGGSDATTRVDQITIDTPATAGAATIVTLTAAQQTTVSAATSLVNAAAAALTVGGAARNVIQFTYGSDTYLAINGDANSTFDGGSDVLIKVTGVSGTIDATDFNIV